MNGQRRIIVGEQFLDHFARLAPGRPAEREEFVQRIFDKDAPMLAFEFARFEMAVTFENRKIENVISNRDTDARDTVARPENAKGKILNREIRFGRDFDERCKRHMKR